MSDPNINLVADGAQAPGELIPRLIARVIDSILIVIAAILLNGILDAGPIWLIIVAALTFGYFVVMDSQYGFTVGKKMMNLRVQGPTGAKPTVEQAALREAFTLLGAFPYLGVFLAFIAWIVIGVTAAGSPAKQGLHDRIGKGTLVVRG